MEQILKTPTLSAPASLTPQQAEVLPEPMTANHGLCTRLLLPQAALQ